MRVYILALLILVFSGCATKSSYAKVNPKPFQVLFTTALDEESNPVESINRISLDEKRVYIYVKWQLPITDREHLTKVFDGEGNLVYETLYNFKPTTVNWHTWTWHNINKNTDRAGKWKFQIFSNGKLLVEKYLEVNAIPL